MCLAETAGQTERRTRVTVAGQIAELKGESGAADGKHTREARTCEAIAFRRRHVQSVDIQGEHTVRVQDGVVRAAEIS